MPPPDGVTSLSAHINPFVSRLPGFKVSGCARGAWRRRRTLDVVHRSSPPAEYETLYEYDSSKNNLHVELSSVLDMGFRKNLRVIVPPL